MFRFIGFGALKEKLFERNNGDGTFTCFGNWDTKLFSELEAWNAKQADPIDTSENYVVPEQQPSEIELLKARLTELENKVREGNK